MLTLYHAPGCPYCVRTRLVLAEKQIPYREVLIDTAAKPPLLRELNPRNRVPVIDHDGLVLYESEVINEYLDAVHPETALLPPDPAGRARVRMLMRRFEDLTDAYYAVRRGEESERPELEAQLAWTDRLLAGSRYLAGDRYTLAEPGWWPWVVRMPMYGVELASYPHLERWTGELAERPAYAMELEVLAAA